MCNIYEKFIGSFRNFCQRRNRPRKAISGGGLGFFRGSGCHFSVFRGGEVLAAAEDLMNRYPGISFDVQLGVGSGYDVRSTDGRIVAECFAVTTISSNDKLNKDCKKLMKSDALVKCVYFYSHQDTEKKIQNRMKQYPEIQIKRISFEELETSTAS